MSMFIDPAILAPGSPLCNAIIQLGGTADLEEIRKAVNTPPGENAELYNRLAVLLEIAAVYAATYK